jgi:hypothetical protein
MLLEVDYLHICLTNDLPIAKKADTRILGRFAGLNGLKSVIKPDSLVFIISTPLKAKSWFLIWFSDWF